MNIYYIYIKYRQGIPKVSLPRNTGCTVQQNTKTVVWGIVKI